MYYFSLLRVTRNDEEVIELPDKIRMRIPFVDKYNLKTNKAKFGKKDGRFHNVLLKPNENLFIHPSYFENSLKDTGFDIALIKIPENELDFMKEQCNFGIFDPEICEKYIQQFSNGMKLISYLDISCYPNDMKKSYDLYSACNNNNKNLTARLNM